MKLRVLFLSLLLTASAYAQAPPAQPPAEPATVEQPAPGVEEPVPVEEPDVEVPQGPPAPTMSPRMLRWLERNGWQAAEPEAGEWSAWTAGEARLALSPWKLSPAGTRWRLGREEARFQGAQDQTTLGLGRGWLFAASGPKISEELLMSLATSLSEDGTVWTTVGQSVKGRPIEVARLGDGPNRTLVFGVFHGDEPAGETACRRLVQYLAKTPAELEGRSVLVCPVLSPDALAAGTRFNANKVDVNRNFPAKNWSSEGKGTRYWGGPSAGSEPETQTVIRIIDEFQPSKIVTIHAPLHNVNYDGPAAELAKRMSALNGYPVEPDIGYPTPGSFGTYVGRERKIPTITLEFPEGGGEEMWAENKSALVEAVRYEPKR